MSDLRIFCANFRSQKVRLCYVLRFYAFRAIMGEYNFRYTWNISFQVHFGKHMFWKCLNRQTVGLKPTIGFHHPIPSSLSAAPPGFRLFKRAAFPLTNAMESCWNNCRIVTVSSSPVWRARELLSFLTSQMADLCQCNFIVSHSWRF